MGESDVMTKTGAIKEKDDNDGFLPFLTTIIISWGGYFKDKRSVGGRGVGKMRSVLVTMTS